MNMSRNKFIALIVLAVVLLGMIIYVVFKPTSNTTNTPNTTNTFPDIGTAKNPTNPVTNNQNPSGTNTPTTGNAAAIRTNSTATANGLIVTNCIFRGGRFTARLDSTGSGSAMTQTFINFQFNCYIKEHMARYIISNSILTASGNASRTAISP